MRCAALRRSLAPVGEAMGHCPPLVWAESDLLVTAEGPTLLAYDAATEGPVWLDTLEGDVLAIGDAGSRIVALTSEGKLFEHGLDGKRLAVRSVPGARGVVASAEHRCVFGPGETLVLDPQGKERRIAVKDVGGAAFSGDGALLLLGTRGGATHVVDPRTGTTRGTGKAPGAVQGAAWSPLGYFVATVRFAKGGIARVERTGEVRPLVGIGDHALDSVSVSRDGAFAAVRIPDHRVMLFDVVGNRPVGMVTYASPETPGQIAFGVGAWLGIAIGHGDANKIDLATGAVRRTDPHPGRPRHRWLLVSDVNTPRVKEVLGGAVARARREVASEIDAPPGSAPSAGGLDSATFARLLVGLVVLMFLTYLAMRR